EQLAGSARQRFPNVTILTESNGSACVPADPHRAAWVGEALLNNACVAARSEVRFRTERDDGHREVVWSIRDDGPGVSKETASQLFTPFFTTRAGNAGLGLALSQKLMSLHRGRLTAGKLSRGGARAPAQI